jgi:hypothetical protein
MAALAGAGGGGGGLERVLLGAPLALRRHEPYRAALLQLVSWLPGAAAPALLASRSPPGPDTVRTFEAGASKRTNLTANNLVADKGFAYFSALGTVTVSPYTGSPVVSCYLLKFCFSTM